jgi:hypothetical protein
MRKTLVMLIACVAVAGTVLPAGAFGRKVHGTFSATAAPLANYSSYTATEKPGCLAGVEDVHWVATPYKAPANGKLSAVLEGFTGDWDLYITDAKGNPLIRSEAEQLGTSGGGAPAKESVALKLRKGKTVNIVACNWLGEPQVEGHYIFAYSR